MKEKRFVKIIAAVLISLLLCACTQPTVQQPTGSVPGTTVTPTQQPTTQPTVTTVGQLEMLLIGEPEITLEYGETFPDDGVRVTYNGLAVAAPVRVDIPQMDTVGEFTVTYTAEYNGITAQLTRLIRVVDTQPPVIRLVSVPGHFTEVGEIYQEEGYEALDNVDGDLTDRVVRTQEGDTVFYTVTDSSGNSTTVQRTVTYGDTQPPQITLLGEASVTIMAGEKFQDPGCKAQDNVDGDISGAVIVTGSYDRYQPGTYTFTYTARDAHGNVAQVTRKLTVKGYVQPEIVEPAGKVIYLTFDDGPSKYTPDLLKILEKYNVKATFFVVGTCRLEYLDDIVEGGHAIGIHSNTHEYDEIYVSEEAFFEDFYAVRDKICEYTGVMTTLCRFPGGSSNRVSMKYCTGIMTRLTKAVEAQGFQYFDWNVSSGDAGDTKSTDQIFKNVTSGIKGKDYAIVLQHDLYKYSINAVERIIQWGLANGYTFMALDPTSPNAHHSVQN